MLKENISKMSDEHTGWVKALDFYKQELDIMKNRLTEIAGKNTTHEVAKDVEHFENQVKLHTENIDNLHHAINSNISKVATQLKENNAGYINTELLTTHDGQKDQFISLEKVINELRHDFNLFAAKWM